MKTTCDLSGTPSRALFLFKSIDGCNGYEGIACYFLLAESQTQAGATTRAGAFGSSFNAEAFAGIPCVNVKDNMDRMPILILARGGDINSKYSQGHRPV